MKNYSFVLAILFSACSQVADFKQFDKIDAHVHLETSDGSFVKLVDEYNFKLLTIAYDASSQNNIDRQINYFEDLYNEHPKSIAFATTFSMEGFGEPNWQEKTIKYLQESIDRGAIALKVWKDIGMTFRDKDSSFILIDDERLDPIWDFIESQNITLVNHNAEPKDCWLPFELMTVKGDSSYYSRHPQYYMYLHPEYPSYEELLSARNRMLDKHPELRYVGCHLGSQEWSVDEQAKFLDMYPNASFDMASRISHFKSQNNNKVRAFFIKYQDRLLYGTDCEISEKDNSTEAMLEIIEETYLKDWDYFSTDKIFTQDDRVKEYMGLNLPTNVLEKIYFKNAIRMYPGFVLNETE